jgi:hypothetical protein
VLAELEALAARLGIAVRAEPFGKGVLAGRGGLCRVDGQPLIVMDASLPLPDRIAVLSLALSQFDLDALHVPPLVRERIDEARDASRGGPPRKRKRPGLARTKPRSS